MTRPAATQARFHPDQRGNNASVNSSSAHPSPPPRVTAGHLLANFASPECGAFAYLGSTPGHFTRGFGTVE